MPTYLAPLSRPRRRTGLAAALILALLAPSAARAGQRSFSAGSLIIPASIEYQTDKGVLGTYSLVYLALYLNATRAKKITFYWAVQPSKLSQYRCNTATETLPSYSPTYNDNDGCDFAVQKSDGQPVSLVAPDNALVAPFDISTVKYVTDLGPARDSGTRRIDQTTHVTKYLGGVWIVDAVDRQAFLDLLKDEKILWPFHKNGTGAANYVNIHNANAAFRAPVVSTLTQKPKRIAAIGTNEFAFVTGVLENSGLCTADTLPKDATSTAPGCLGTATSGNSWPRGVVVDYYQNPGDLLDGPGSSANGFGELNETVNGTNPPDYIYGGFWATDEAGSPMFTPTRLANLARFLDVKGHAAYVQYDAIWHVENTQTASRPTVDATDYLTTGGIDTVKPDVKSAEDCNDQVSTTTKFHSSNSDCLVLAGANQPWAQTGNFVFDGGQGQFKAFNLLSGSTFNTGVIKVAQVKDGPTVSAGYYKDNDPEKGLLLYLAGHKFDNGRLWGERLLLNTLFANLQDNNPELARSEPVGYVNPRVTTNTTQVYQGTYVQKPLPDSNDVVTYTPDAAEKWAFPFTTGHLYEWDIGSLTKEDFGASSKRNWDAAAKLPLPGDRKIYTYVGGSANLKWRRIEFKHTEVEETCTDTDTTGSPGKDKCDLAELLALGNSAGVTVGALKDKNDADRTQAQKLGMLVQQVRGFCSAHTPAITGTPIMEPTDGQCDRSSQGNQARLGGIDHSTPAVIGPSKYITKTYGTRPVVIYAGGRDGMLHAFYVSPGDGTKTTAWSADGEAVPANVAAGQELWAIVPPGQVPRLAYNDAMVDGTINVVDVFGNFPYDRNNDGVIDWTVNSDPDKDERPNGTREWRTVLIASAAAPPSDAYEFRGGSELFALDVTNPLRPVLLWHLDGPTSADDRFDIDKNGAFGAAEKFDPTNPATYALKWKDEAGVDYFTTDADTIEKMKTGRYDYRNLGLTYSTAVAKVWDGGAYRYLLYAATNSVDYTDGTPTGFRGAEIFAIDLITGQKQWQWEHRYDAKVGPGVDNSIPPRMALGDIDANGSTERIYLGDMEGHVWELYSRDGRNANYKLGDDKIHHSFPLFGTMDMTGTPDPDKPELAATDETKALYAIEGTKRLSQQPLTTPIGQGRFTEVPPGKENYLSGRLSLVIGTMGVDWAIAPFEKGHLFVIPIYPDMGTRLAEPIEMTSSTIPNPMLYGVLKKEAAWQIDLLVGERVYGMPRVVNNRIVFNTAFGSFAGDISTSFTDPGNYRIEGWQGGENKKDMTANDAKSFGGVLVIDGNVVVSTDKNIENKGKSSLTTGGVNTKTFNRSTPAVMKSWEVTQ